MTDINAVKLSKEGRVNLIGEMRRHPARNTPAAQAYIQDRNISTLVKEDMLNAAIAMGIDLTPYLSDGTRTADKSGALRDPDAAPEVLDRIMSAELDAAAEHGAANISPEELTAPIALDKAAIDAKAESEAQRIINSPFPQAREAIATLVRNGTANETTLAGVRAQLGAAVARIGELEAAVANVAAVPAAATAHVALPAGGYTVKQVATLPAAKVFNLPADAPKHLRTMPVAVFDDPAAPAVDTAYRWDYDVLEALLMCLQDGTRPWLHGPKGTGKTSAIEQLAARTRRAFVLIGMDASMTRLELFGGLRMAAENGVSVSTWVHGVLTRAIQHPNTLVLIDEITTGRPGELVTLHATLQNGYVVLEDGETVHTAAGVLICAADNTNGAGDATNTYADTRQMNVALLDRFGAFIPMDYMPAEAEAAALVSKVPGLPRAVADIMIGYATNMRAKVLTGDAGVPPSLRGLTAWARFVVRGMDARRAWDLACGGSLNAVDRETANQIVAATVNADDVRRLMKGEALPVSPDPVALAPDTDGGPF